MYAIIKAVSILIIMTKLTIDHYAQYEEGSAEYVVALAGFQKSNNLPIKLSFRGKQNNDALDLAKSVIELKRLQDVDAFALAEEVSGVSYKKETELGKKTAMLGLDYHLDLVKRRDDTVKKIDDTTFSGKLVDYIRVAQEEGFEKVLEIPFTKSDEWNGKTRIIKEKYFIFFNKKDGILLAFDTYNGDSVNGGSLYYNIILKEKASFNCLNSSSPCEINGVKFLTGHHDCRYGIRSIVNGLRENCNLLNNWLERPHLFLVHHGETSSSYETGFDYAQLTNQKILKLPQHVQDAITPKPENIMHDLKENSERTMASQEFLVHLKKAGFVSKVNLKNPKTGSTTIIENFNLIKYYACYTSVGDDCCRGRATLIEKVDESGKLITVSKIDDSCTQTAEFSARDVISFEI